MRFLVVESETASERDARRESAGKSAGESFAATLGQLAPGCGIVRVEPADPGADVFSASDISAFDAVFLSGSPLHVYEPSPEVERQLAFVRSVFASGTPSFGSCAGLQLAAAAAGGRVGPIDGPREAGLARRLTAERDASQHPLFVGRGLVWDAAAIHGDEVIELPPGSRVLARNGRVRIQAAEIRYGRGIFWGVQYHPELSPGEMGAALRRSSDELVRDGIGSADDVEEQASLFDRLEASPDDLSAWWRLGVDAEYAREDRRRRELRNFLDNLPALRS